MTTPERHRALDLEPLEQADDPLLSDDERQALAAARAADPGLAEQAEALAGAYAAWSARTAADQETPWSADLSERVVAAALAAREAREETEMSKKPALAEPAPAVLAAVADKIRLTCTYCHAVAEREALAYCAACLAPHHEGCFREHGSCAAPGCQETRIVLAQETRPEPRQGRILPMIGLLVGTSVAALVARNFAATPAAPAAPLAQVSAAPSTSPESAPAPRAATRLALSLERVTLAEAVALLDERIPEVELGLRDEDPRGPSEPAAPSERFSLELPEVHWQTALQALARAAEARLERVGEDRVLLARPKRATIQFTDASLPGVFRQIGSYAGVSIEVDPGVRGSVTCDLKQVPWDEALLAICATRGLRVWTTPRGLRIGPAGPQRPGEVPLTLPAGLDLSLTPLSYSDASHRVDLPAGELDLDAAVRLLGVPLAVEPRVQTSEVGRTIRLEAASDLPWQEALRRVAAAARCQVLPQGREELLTLTQPPRVTIQFTEANVRTVLQLLAAYSGKNIVLSGEVAGQVTLNIRELEWDLALASLATATRGRLWQVGAAYVLLPESAPAPAGGRPFRVAPTWTGRPPALTPVRLGRGSVAELCSQVAAQAGARVECEVDDAAVQRLDLEGVGWRRAIRDLARVAGCWVEDVQGGVRVFPRQRSQLRAYDAPLGPWLQLLGAEAGRQLVLDPTALQQRITTRLSDVSPLDAFAGSVRSLGLTMEVERERLIRVYAGERLPAPSEQAPAALGRIECFGSELAAPALQAVLQREGQPTLAILGNTIYREGERLIDHESAEHTELVLRKIGLESVELGLADLPVLEDHPVIARLELEGGASLPRTRLRYEGAACRATLELLIGLLDDRREVWQQQRNATHRLLAAGAWAAPYLTRVALNAEHPGRGSAAWALGHLLLRYEDKGLDALSRALAEEGELGQVDAQAYGALVSCATEASAPVRARAAGPLRFLAKRSQAALPAAGKPSAAAAQLIARVESGGGSDAAAAARELGRLLLAEQAAGRRGLALLEALLRASEEGEADVQRAANAALGALVLAR